MGSRSARQASTIAAADQPSHEVAAKDGEQVVDEGV